ncbi:hypothetical protein Q5424_15160 [Conexibacter sp. JD483]|uniref:hypothetical protein n=1 Tax=unclassified Conexibacter TaxID=2627773 RepID=UPI00271B365E|nr:MULTISPECIES: hypothetical protein [unclassified Conexibacter]MDO8188145.1 hypothetical protein [Conexibacter sp. CPCC 205706]MDO8201291.1 hypothetical protein [Conexibacter sp. CPCC 205762]MDR9370437.1 hypothetical protein [Conexibacter sp. JD483]
MSLRLARARSRLSVLAAATATAAFALPLLAPPASHAAVRGRARPLHVVGVAADVEQGKPLRGATVRLVAVTRGRRGRTVTRLVARAKRARSGAVIFRLRHVPKTLRVVVSGGRVAGKPFGGRMLAQVSRHRSGDFMLVSPATTVLTHYRIAHPRVRARVAEQRVRRFLRIPRGFALAHASRFARPADLRFSGLRMIGTARASGGYDRYARRLARRIRTKTPPLGPDLAPRGRAATATVATGAPTARLARSTPSLPSWLPNGVESLLLTGLGGALEKGADGIASSITDLALSWLGQNVPFLSFLSGDNGFEQVEQQLEQISAQLTQLQLSVNALQSSVYQLEQLVTEGTFDTLTQNALKITNAVDTTTANLSGIAQFAADGRSAADISAAWTAFMTNLGNDLVNATGEGTLSTLLGSYLDPPVGNGLLYWANQVVTYADANGQQGLYGWQESYVPLRTMLYYAAYEASAAQFEALWYRSPTSYGGGGLPDAEACATPAATPSCRVIAAAQNDLGDYPEQVLPVLPPNTVLDLSAGRMWVTALDRSAQVTPSGCSANCTGMFSMPGSLVADAEDAYQTLGPATTWQVPSTQLPGVATNGSGRAVDGGAAAFSAATQADIGSLVPGNPTLPSSGATGPQVPATVKQWLGGAAGFDPGIVGDRVLLGDGTVPTYPVPIVNVSAWDPTNQQQDMLCTWGGSNGFSNWQTYLLTFNFIGVSMIQPQCSLPLPVYDMPPGGPLPGSYPYPGQTVGASDISTQPWNQSNDDVFLRQNLVAQRDARACSTQGTAPQSGSYWQIAGGLETSDGQHFQFYLNDTGLFSGSPVNWTAASSPLTFNLQTLDTTQQSFPQVSWSGPVQCGRGAGSTLLVRPVNASFYMTPGGN